MSSRTKEIETISLLHFVVALGITQWIEFCTTAWEGPLKRILVNIPDERGQSPLHYALQRGHQEAVILLRKLGAQVDDRSVFTAAIEGHLDILELFLSWGGNVNARGYNVDSRECDREPAIWDTCGIGLEQVARVLLSHGADPNALSPAMLMDPNGIKPFCDIPTPAFVAACMGGITPLVQELLPVTNDIHKYVEMGLRTAIAYSRDATIRYLACHPCISPIPHDSDRERKFYFLALNSQVSIATSTLGFLIDRFGTSIDVVIRWDKDDLPCTMLEMAMCTPTPDLDTLCMLLRKGAKISPNFFAQRIVQFAIKKNCTDMVDHLLNEKLEMGISLHLASERGSLEVARLIVAKSFPVNIINGEKQTPLIVAAENGHVGVVRLLLKKGATVNARDITGQNARMKAMVNGHDTVIRAIDEWVGGV
jgi:hypothetical protein